VRRAHWKSRPALFAYGFRPFFLGAGLVALLYVPWWAGSVSLGWQLSTTWPPTLWHGHEMLFGFIVAAIAGFLLTAVPSWTGQRGFAGWPLAGAFAVWLGGRVAILGSGHWPLWTTAALDLAFLPTVAVLVAIPLLRSRNRNTPLLAVLAALWGCNVAFHWGLSHQDVPLASGAIRVGLDIVLVLVTVIGGRIVPAFTASGLKQAGISVPLRAWPFVTEVTIAVMVTNVLADAFMPGSLLVAAVAAAASVAHVVRLAQWRSLHTRGQPIVWILHVGYAWLAAGMALKAAALVAGPVFSAFWLHALTIGSITSMILGVMTRAALGHTGRPLVVNPMIAAAYLLVSITAIVRVFALGTLGLRYPTVILASGLLWAISFALYLSVYAPILCGPRVDGRNG
jgi:uncharacterized protein involved in response to NO